jgi:hypothetical protein
MTKNTLPLLATSLLLAWAAGSVQAQAVYRIVGPDGRVTFSDTAPLAGASATTPGSASSGNATSNLPYLLRQVASRYPVTLYTGGACGPCDTGRNYLRARGIPFAERTVTSPDDVAALQRMSGDAGLPFLTIGSQQLKGFSDAEWGQFLDAADYPKTSQLPAGYQHPAATPLVTVERAGPAANDTARAAPSSSPGVETVNTRPRPVPAPKAPVDPNPAGIRF